MVEQLKAAFAYAKSVFVTGAIMASSRKAELEICSRLPKHDGAIIVEYGMGLGNITQEILNSVSPTAKVYAFEVKEDFCEKVRNTIKDDRLIIVNDGAENVRKHVPEQIDAVLASIPFSFFSKEVAMGILQDSYDLLKPNSYYSQVLYTKFNFKKFEAVFDQCERTMQPFHVPMEYIFHCQKLA